MQRAENHPYLSPDKDSDMLMVWNLGNTRGTHIVSDEYTLEPEKLYDLQQWCGRGLTLSHSLPLPSMLRHSPLTPPHSFCPDLPAPTRKRKAGADGGGKGKGGKRRVGSSDPDDSESSSDDDEAPPAPQQRAERLQRGGRGGGEAARGGGHGGAVARGRGRGRGRGR